jgi:hypothetical protein
MYSRLQRTADVSCYQIKYNQWRNAGKPKGRENPLKSQLMVAKRLLRKAQTGICIAERMLGKKYHDSIILSYQIISLSAKKTKICRHTTYSNSSIQ